jgi:hypothetical protein
VNQRVLDENADNLDNALRVGARQRGAVPGQLERMIRGEAPLSPQIPAELPGPRE